ncbi:MAG: sulfatase [Bacteroidales bacterium]|nr:sulfatase [Bacteroidales bacterium]
MNYLKLSKTLALGIPVVLASCNPSGDKNSEKARDAAPNIILILSDDQAWTDYSFMGHDHIQTPNIDRLASKGLTFTQGYVPASLCRPSLASLITGLYPHQHKVLGNDPVMPDREKYSWGTEFLIQRAAYNKPVIENFESFETLPELLHNRGYVSFQTGKWWEGVPANSGFDFALTHGDPSRGGRHGDEGLRIGREGMDTIFNFIDYATDKEKPFFLWYAPFLPHSPHTPPDSLLEKYLPLAPTKAVAAYWAMCEFFDITCGQLMDYIDDKGLAGNTLFIYVCDNGWIQDPDKPNEYADPSKRSPYDMGIRTPIMFAWEGVIEPEMNTKELVSSIDIVPTVLDMVGIEKSGDMHGINVLDKAKLNERDVIFGEIYAHDFTTIDSSVYYRIAITDPYKLILPDAVNRPGEVPGLFNLKDDPYEKVNLAGENPQVLQDLTDRIDELWKGN